MLIPQRSFNSIFGRQVGINVLECQGSIGFGVAERDECLYCFIFEIDPSPAYDVFCQIRGRCTNFVTKLNDHLFGGTFTDAFGSLEPFDVAAGDCGPNLIV
jgi:hypothetical protein